MSRPQFSSTSTPPPTTTSTRNGRADGSEPATSMCGLDSEGKLCIHPSSSLASFHQMMQELSQSHSVTSRNKIVNLGDEAIRHCNEEAATLARYMSLCIITSDARMKLPAIFLCDHIIRSAKKATNPDAYSVLLKAFERHLPAIYYHAKSAAAGSVKSSYEIEKIDKCYKIWQEKPFFAEPVFYETSAIWEISQLVQSYKFVSSSSTHPDLASADAVARLMFRYKNLATLINSSGLTPGDKLRNLEAFVKGGLQLAMLEPKNADDDSLEVNMNIQASNTGSTTTLASSATTGHSVSGAISPEKTRKISDFGHIAAPSPRPSRRHHARAEAGGDNEASTPNSSGTGGNRSSSGTHGRTAATKPNRPSNVLRNTLGEVFDYSSDEDANKTPGSTSRRAKPSNSTALAPQQSSAALQQQPAPQQQLSLADRFRQIASSTPSMLLSNRLNMMAQNSSANNNNSSSGNDAVDNRYAENSVQQQQQQQQQARPDFEKQYNNMYAEIAASSSSAIQSERDNMPNNSDGFDSTSRRRQMDDVTAALSTNADSEERRLRRLGQQQHLPSTSSSRRKRSHSRSRSRSRSRSPVRHPHHATNAEPQKRVDDVKLVHIDEITRTTLPPPQYSNAFSKWPHKQQHLTLYTRTIWLGHLPKKSAPSNSKSSSAGADDLEQEIRGRLRRYGEIESLNLIQARGCCYVAFQRRASGEQVLDSRLHDDFYISKQKIKINWSPNKGFSDFLSTITNSSEAETLKKSFNVDDGFVHVPLNKIITQNFSAQKMQETLDQLSQGGIIDYRTLSTELHAQGMAKKSNDVGVSRDSVHSNDGMDIESAETAAPTSAPGGGGSAISTIIGGSAIQQQQQQQPYVADPAMLTMMRAAPPQMMMNMPPEIQQQMMMMQSGMLPQQFPPGMQHQNFGQFAPRGSGLQQLSMMPSSGGSRMPPQMQQQQQNLMMTMQQRPPGGMPPNMPPNFSNQQQQFGGPQRPMNNSSETNHQRPQFPGGGPGLLQPPPGFHQHMQRPPNNGSGPQQIHTLGGPPQNNNHRPPLLSPFGAAGGPGMPPRFMPPFSMSQQRPPFNNNNNLQNISSPCFGSFNNVDKINEVENMMMSKQRSSTDVGGSGGERKRKSRFDDDDRLPPSGGGGSTSERKSSFRDDESRHSSQDDGFNRHSRGESGGRFPRGGHGGGDRGDSHSFHRHDSGGERGRGGGFDGRGRGSDGPSRFPRGGPSFGQHRPTTPASDSGRSGRSDSGGGGDPFPFDSRGGRGSPMRGRGGDFRGGEFRGGRGRGDFSPDKMRGGGFRGRGDDFRGGRGGGGRGDFQNTSPFRGRGGGGGDDGGRGGRGGFRGRGEDFRGRGRGGDRGGDRGGRGGGGRGRGMAGDPSYNFPAPPTQLLHAAAAAAQRAGDDPSGSLPPREFGGRGGRSRFAD